MAELTAQSINMQPPLKFTEEQRAEQQMNLFRSRVRNEVARSNAKHGYGRNLDNGTGTDDLKSLRDSYQIQTEIAMDMGLCTWRDIFLEEVFEAMAEEDEDKLIVELTQCSAVIENWVDNILRRKNKAG